MGLFDAMRLLSNTTRLGHVDSFKVRGKIMKSFTTNQGQINLFPEKNKKKVSYTFKTPLSMC